MDVGGLGRPALVYSAFHPTFLLSLAMLAAALLWVNAKPPLELTPTDAVVRVYRTRRIPWPKVTRIRPATYWRGGILLQTAWGEEVRAPAPASWWGGPASPAQVAEVEQWWHEHRVQTTPQ